MYEYENFLGIRDEVIDEFQRIFIEKENYFLDELRVFIFLNHIYLLNFEKSSSVDKICRLILKS